MAFYVASYGLAVAFGIAVPDDVLQRYDAAQALVGWMSGWNAQIRTLGEMEFRTAGANQFLYSVLWCVMPLYWGLLLRDLHARHRPAFQLQASSRAEPPALIAAGLLIVYVGTHFPKNGRGAPFLFGNELTRSVMAPLIVFSVGTIAILVLCFVVALATGRFRYRAPRKQ